MKLEHYKNLLIAAALVALLASCASTQKYDAVEAETNLSRVVNIQKAPGKQLVVRLNGESLFEGRSAVLKPEAHSDVAALASYLNISKYEYIDIEGYAGPDGEESFRQELARQRAYSMRSALYLEGVDPGRMTARGEGELYPDDSTATAEGRADRKRTEALLLIR
jgi:outer membrane protein OmpA-like peptidoglycan-associated protein